MDYIAANFDKRLKINELADRIGVNRSYLTSSFKKKPRMLAAGISYESSHREGKDSSENGDIQVSEVAAKVGYGDPLAFPRYSRQEQEEVRENTRKKRENL